LDTPQAPHRTPVPIQETKGQQKRGTVVDDLGQKNSEFRSQSNMSLTESVSIDQSLDQSMSIHKSVSDVSHVSAKKDKTTTWKRNSL
jgi:hypothetical protein